MSARSAVRRVESFMKGKPIPNGETLRMPIIDPGNLMLLAFVRMGGESRPWGVGHCLLEAEPVIHVVPEPRDPDLVAQMMCEFAPALLTHLQPAALEDCEDEDAELPFRQIWLPNSSHISMLHMLAMAYTFIGRSEESSTNRDPKRRQRVPMLNALGRACNWLFRESQRPGDAMAMDAAAALRDAYTFPADDLRQQHLGFLLAWLGTKGGRERRESAAKKAEDLAISTTLDPEIERDGLEDVVRSYDEARDAGKKTKMKGAAAEIEQVLRGELERRIELCRDSVRTLLADRREVNPGADSLVELSQSDWTREYLEPELATSRGERAFITSPETDKFAASAAFTYLQTVYSDELQTGATIHYDAEMQEEAIATGDAFRGQVVNVENWPTPEKPKTAIPIWTIESDGDGPLRLREGSKVAPAGIPAREGVIRRISSRAAGGRRFEVEIEGWKTARKLDDPKHPGLLAATDPGLIGTELVMVTSSGAGITGRKRFRVLRRRGPGAWLTHAGKGRPKLSTGKRRSDVLAEIDKLRGAA